ncbi:MarR family winged helix-turn-helix transcriptional regulator [Kineosporia succinea]|uniref:DNA-binding MarR family transcriptional regulator n=1 Tax=Kineosporia succinea TaxID=84632 RepID=A0ABT9P2W4_9ACTN|nr:MarR family transcriptional regulator [Kineosporia succinea]MDP9826560.1 DNA-binding MarR family transcriptional regulator [Kineosporia succinea]
MNDGTRWLDPEELASWRAMAGIVFMLPAALDAQLQRDAGITHFEYTVMAGLSEAEGRRLRMSYLALLANGSLSRLSHVVKRLEKQGWVVRAPDPADGRYTVATLTDAGWDKVVATAPGHADAVRQFVIDPLTRAQVRHLGEIGKRIHQALDPDGDDCPGASPP